MNETVFVACDAFLRSGVLLAVAALVIGIFLRTTQLTTPAVHRIAWGGVVVCGLLISPFSLEVPWYDPESSTIARVLSPSAPDADLMLRTDHAVGVAQSIPLGVALQQQRASGWAAIDWQVVVCSVWLGGMLATLGVMGLSYVLLLLSLRHATPANGLWQREWQQLLLTQTAPAPIRLLVHRRLGPMLCRSPRGCMVVVPQRLWKKLSAVERLAILRHELAHYQRGDVWTSLVARLLVIPHWYNPIAWWVVRRFEEAAEWACDEQLLANPQQIPAFVRGLLAVIEPQTVPVGSSAAGGSSLAVRLRRLLSFQSQRDSNMKRAMLLAVLICLMGLGLLRIDLVARAQEEFESLDAEARLTEQIASFGSQLAGAGPVRELKEALTTQAGQIVLRDHISYFEERLRDEARIDALPTYLEEHFVKEGDTYRWRDGQEEFRRQLVTAVKTFNEDVAKIEQALQEIATDIEHPSEVNRLLARFMNSEAAAPMLYVEHLRERLRPDMSLVERMVGELFVAHRQGNYIVRPGRRAEAEQMLPRIRQVANALPAMRDELQQWSLEFVEKDEFHKRVKQAFAEPRFATFVATELVGEGDINVAEEIDHFFQHLGNIAVDTAEGLEIVEQEALIEFEEFYEEYRRAIVGAEKLAGPLRAFAARINTSEDLERGFQDIMLNSDLLLIRLSREHELMDAEPGEIIRDMLGDVLAEDDQGKLHVTEQQAEEVTEFVREMFRHYRFVRRHGREIDRLAKQLEDAELKDALSSRGGKFVVLHSIRNSLREAEFDGFDMWINEHFEETDGGWALREHGEEMVRDFLTQVREINQQLSNDDFKR